MKLKLSLLLLLCPLFGAFAQPGNLPQGLKIGDKVPNVLLTNISNYRSGTKDLREVQLSHFQGKLLILDFWATWCAPCISMIPRMDSLQKQFAGRIQFLPVTYQPEKVVSPVLARLRKGHDFDLPEVTGDIVLHQLFPHHSLPHYVWVGPEGTVRAITENKEVNAAQITAMLNNGVIQAEQKKDFVIPYEIGKPLLAGGNGGDGTSLIYHSLLTAYIPGLPGGMNVSAYDSIRGQKFNVRNVPLTWLYRLAFGYGKNWFSDAQILILSKDSAHITTRLTGQAYLRWLEAGNGYCYELQVPPNLAETAFLLMQQQLGLLFNAYQVNVEQRSTAALSLVRTSKTDKLKTLGGKLSVEVSPFACHLRNARLHELMVRLNQQYLQNSPVPLTDDTGYTGRVDLDLDASLTNIDSLNKALFKYDLQFIRKESKVEMLVVRDRVATNTSGKNPQ